MSRMLIVLGIAVGFLGASMIGRADHRTSASLAPHPAIGAWQWHNDPADARHVSYVTFHVDGTYLEVGMGATGVGLWRSTGDRSVEVTSFVPDIAPDPNRYEPGTGIIRHAYTVDEAGDTITGSYDVEMRMPNDLLVVQAGPFQATGTRLQIEPMGAAGPVSQAPPRTFTAAEARLEQGPLATLGNLTVGDPATPGPPVT